MKYTLKNIGILFLIYVGTIFYTLAAYYHLTFGNKWRFIDAFLVAIPLVVIEYTFSLPGNHYANLILKLSAQNILTITVCFYFINLWLLNYFVLKHKVNMIREIVAFILIIMAFLCTTVFEHEL